MGPSFALLVGIQNGAVTIENSTAVLEEVRNGITLNCGNSTSGCVSERLEFRILCS